MSNSLNSAIFNDFRLALLSRLIKYRNHIGERRATIWRRHEYNIKALNWFKTFAVQTESLDFRMRIFIGLSIIMIGSHVSAFMSLLGKIDSDPTLLGANHFQPINIDVSIIWSFWESQIETDHFGSWPFTSDLTPV